MAKEVRRKRNEWDDLFGEFDGDFENMRGRLDQILEGFMRGELDAEQCPLVYGFSMRVGNDGAPVIQEFGNALGSRKEGEGKELLREPLTDIIESEGEVRVIVELPGVEKKEIKVNAIDRALDIGVENPDKPFSKHLDLPCDVRWDSAKANYRNGVLEVVLTRVAPKKRSKAIKVE